jgi:capsular exopolysaccharide synthesis family protein
VAATQPGCFAAQQYRVLRTRLERRDNGGSHLWLITSPCSGDGKTTTSANLALAMSHEVQQRVVLVEADLERPRLAALFGAPAGPGLVDLLMGTSTLEETLVELPDHRLWLLPAGAGLTAGPSRALIASTMMPRAMAGLRARFTRIVVDTPASVAAETPVLTRLADGILVVVRAGATPRSALARTLALIDRQQMMGVVLNSVEMSPHESGYPNRPPRRSGS